MTQYNNSSNSNAPKKILIFLDIDGVMQPFPHSKSSSFGGTFPDSTVTAFSKILEAFPSAEVVLSSTWRVQTNAINEIINNFQLYGKQHGGPLKGFKDFHGMTDVAFHGSRQHEIANYLKARPDKIDAWVALDDEELVEGKENQLHRSEFEGHFVQTNCRYGLTEVDAKKAIQLLNNQLGKKELGASGHLRPENQSLFHQGDRPVPIHKDGRSESF